MKAFICLVAGLFSLSAFADPGCGVLNQVVGHYAQTTAACADPSYKYGFADFKTLEVPKMVSLTENGQTYLQGWIYLQQVGNGARIGFGPSTKANDLYACSSTSSAVTIYDPDRDIQFQFTGQSVSITSRACSATFKKVN